MRYVWWVIWFYPFFCFCFINSSGFRFKVWFFDWTTRGWLGICFTFFHNVFRISYIMKGRALWNVHWLVSSMSIVDMEPLKRNLRSLLNIADLLNVNLKKPPMKFSPIRHGMRIHITTETFCSCITNGVFVLQLREGCALVFLTVCFSFFFCIFRWHSWAVQWFVEAFWIWRVSP